MSTPKKSSKLRKIFKWLFLRIPIALLIIGGVMIIALKVVERFPEPLQQGLEQYLSEATNTKATIESLEKFAFFPNIDIRMNKLTLHDGANAALIPMKAEYIELVSPLGSVLTTKNKIKNIEVKNLKAKAGILTPLDLEITRGEVIDKEGPEQYGSFLVLEGKYDGETLFFEAEVKKVKDVYKVPANIPFSITLGPKTLNAQMDKGLASVTLKNVTLKRGNDITTARDYPFVVSGKYNNDNPLHCMLYYGNGNKCNKYLERQ